MNGISFKRKFYEAFDNSLDVQNKKPREHGPQPVLFCDEKYHGVTIEQFIALPDFQQCLREYIDLVDWVVTFVKDNSENVLPNLKYEEIESVRKEFDVLKDHLSDVERDFFRDKKPEAFGALKENFHIWVDLIKDERLPIGYRVDSIKKVSEAVFGCTGGMNPKVVQEINKLKFSVHGIKGVVHQAKFDMILNCAAEYVMSNPPDDYEGNETHYGNAFFNYAVQDGKGLGVNPIPDDSTTEYTSKIRTEQFEACKKNVLERLTAVNLANVIADDYLARIKNAAAGFSEDISGPIEGDALVRVCDAVRTARIGWLDRQFGDVPEETYLLSVPGTFKYQLAPTSTLLAKHFLEAMKGADLVDYDQAVTLTRRSDGADSVMQLGSLFWLDSDGEHTPLNGKDLLDVPPRTIIQTLIENNIQREGCEGILQEVAQKVLDAIETEKITDVSEEWLAGLVDHFKEHEGSNRDWITPVLMLAAVFNRTDAMRSLVAAGADFFVRNTRGMNALELAAMKGHTGILNVFLEYAVNERQVELLDSLIDMGADVDARIPNGETAAMIAARNGDAQALRMLMETGADLAAISPNGETALTLAALNCPEGTLIFLLFASCTKQVEAMRVLIADGADVNARDGGGCTPLMHAAQKKYAEAVEVLIKDGADVNAVDVDGTTALMHAAFSGGVDVIEMLIKAAQLRVEYGCSVLADVEVSIKAGANVNACNRDDMTALLVAAKEGHLDAQRLLLSAGADVNASNKLGLTALMYAAQRCNSEAVSLLIANGADVNATDSQGTNAVMFATEANSVEVLQKLIAAGADVNVRGPGGVTALRCAIALDRRGAREVLVSAGAI